MGASEAHATRTDPDAPHGGRVSCAAAAAAVLLCAAVMALHDRSWQPRPHHALGLAWWAVVVSLLPRSRVAVSLLALAIALRAATYAPRLHLHVDRGWSSLEEAGARLRPGHPMGDGWAALLSWPEGLLGSWMHAVHVQGAVISALTVPLLFGAVRLATGDRMAAGFAGALLAFLPLHLVLAPAETRFVAVGALQVAAVYGLLRSDRPGDALAWLSAGLLAHLRPEQGAIALGLLGLAACRRRWGAAVPLATLLAWRAAELAADSTRGDAWNLAGLAGVLEARWVGVGGALLPTDPTVDPTGVVVLAAAGGALALRRRDASAWLLMLGLVGTLAYAYQPREADRLRYHVAAQPWLAALAGVGLAALVRASRSASMVVAVGVAVSFAPTASLWRPLAWTQVYRVARAALPRLREGQVVRYDATLDRNGPFRRWAERHGPARWLPLDGPLAPGELRWVGLGDHAGPRVPDLAGLTPLVSEIVLAPRWGGMADYGPFADAPLVVGLYDTEDPLTAR